MEKEKINISSENVERITQDLLKRGLTDTEINRIIYGEYQTFSDENELEDEKDFLDLIQALSDGYSMQELEKIGISSWKIHKFEKFLECENLNEAQVVAMNRYSAGSDMMWGSKKNSSKRAIYDKICQDFSKKFSEYGFSSKAIADIQYQVKCLDYTKPLYENYAKIKEKLTHHNFANQYMSEIQTFVLNLNSFYHLDETIHELEYGLKTNIEDSIKVYRAVKKDYFKQYVDSINDLKSRKIRENNFLSTSPIYDACFAKYDDYDVVMEMYVPKGTIGRNISQFSNYGTTEQEIVLNGADLYIFDIEPNVIDKNGRNKTFLKTLVLSRDKEVYKYIEEDEMNKLVQLPKKQNRLTAFFASLIAKLTGKKYESNSEINQSKPDEQTKETNPWVVSEEKINKAQVDTVPEKIKNSREEKEHMK